MDGAISEWVADECNRILGQELPREPEAMHADLAEARKQRKLAAWGEFDDISPQNACHVQKQIIQSRWVLTRTMVEGKKCVKARLVAEGFQDPDQKEGLVDTSGCVSLRSSHLQVVSLSAIRRWKLWSLDTKHAFLQADGFGCDVFFARSNGMGSALYQIGAETSGAGVRAECCPGCLSSLIEAPFIKFEPLGEERGIEPSGYHV